MQIWKLRYKSLLAAAAKHTYWLVTTCIALLKPSQPLNRIKNTKFTQDAPETPRLVTRLI